MSTPKQEYIEQWKKICREEWFKDHKATQFNGVSTSATSTVAIPVPLIYWQKPGTWNYGCHFIIHRRWLCVVGDFGEATFEWSEDITLEFLAGLDFGYFLSKCRASATGKACEEWDNKVAERNIEEYIEELNLTPPDEQSDQIKGTMEILSNVGDYSNDYELQNASKEIYDSTGDAETAGSISNMGTVPSTHVIGMFVGLQMAIQQLKEAK